MAHPIVLVIMMVVVMPAMGRHVNKLVPSAGIRITPEARPGGSCECQIPLSTHQEVVCQLYLIVFKCIYLYLIAFSCI